MRGSTDGRYVTMDRPALAAGRLPTGRDEALVTEDVAAAQDIEVGDVLPLSFWGRLPGTDLHPDFVDDDQLDTVRFPPLGVEQLTVVGIGTLADEVLPDELYPRSRIIVSPDVAARYDCLPDAPALDATFEQAFDALVGEGCAAQYGYYSLEVDGGDEGVAAAMDAFLDRAADLNDQLSTDLREQAGAGYFLIPTTTAQERERVERSIQPTVAALWALGGMAAAVTLVVTGLAVARELRRSEDELGGWWQLGLTTAERLQVVTLPLLVALGSGLVLAVGAAWALSPIGPVGSVRSVEPSPARELSGWVGLGAAGLVGLTAITTLLLAHRAARRAGRRPPARAGHRGPVPAISALHGLLRRSKRPEVVEGVRAAQTGYRGTGLVMASGGVAAAVFMAAVVFGASLATLVSTPAAYGWPWDVAAMVNFGYGPADLDRVARDLADRDDVASWSAFGFSGDLTVDGAPVVSVVVDYDRPVRPAEIVDADRMQAMPLLAGTLLVVAAVIGLALAVVLSVRSRRRELAILRALGFTGRQLRTSVRVQALVTMAVALLVGVPGGIVLGRLVWRLFADELGVAAGPAIPLGWVAATVAGGAAVALLAAALPARVAARVDPAAALRSE